MPVNFQRIRELRDGLNLTQQQAAIQMGLKGPQAMVRWNNIEKGKYQNLGLRTLESVAYVLRCQVPELLTPIDLEKPMRTARGAAQNRRRPSSAAGSKG